jgi:hypothetical protein
MRFSEGGNTEPHTHGQHNCLLYQALLMLISSLSVQLDTMR